jgi:dTMP kinase
MNQGIFIVFEGIDGSGKSTHIKLLTEELQKRDLFLFVTKEYTDNPIGRLIKDYAEGSLRNLSPETEALLFAADRREHLKKINDSLMKGKTVISDRYIHSSLAYQGALGLSLEWIRILNRFIRKPDLVLLLDIDPNSSLKRVIDRKPTVFEEDNYLHRVREIYLKLVEKGEITRIDADRPISEVHRDIMEKVDNLLKENKG